VAETRWLRTHYAAIVERHPRLASRLHPLISELDTHLRVLSASGPRPSAEGNNGPPSPGASGPDPPSVPGNAAAAFASLARAEQAAARRRLRQVVAASPRLARVVAAIGASSAARGALLTQWTRERET